LWDVYLEFGVVIGAAVLISFVSLTLTPMLNAYLMKGGEQKIKFYNLTEPYFKKLNSNYAEALETLWVKNGGVPYPFRLFWIDFVFYNLIKRNSSYDDRSSLILRITAPEGSSYEYTDRFMQEISKLVDDSIPAKKSKFSGHLTWLWIFFRKQRFCASVTKRTW
jgi:HAE1 family hydrophobic/amphiphilic exporter-1/multidrug efflux pump